MDVESVKATLRSVDWKKWAKIGGFVLLWLLGISVVLSILAGIFIGIPMAAFGLLSKFYEYISTREHKYYYAAGFIALLVVVMIIFRRVGLVSLSSQTLAHRRNLFFAFFLVFLIENFDVDVAKMFKAENDQINAAAKGILALFALYSCVEYAHNCLYDFLRSRNDSKIIDSPKFFRAPGLVDFWLVLIGNYRVLFDIALPVATSAFILLIYSSDVGTVFGIGKEYVSREIAEYIEEPGNSEIQSLVEQASGKINTAVENIEEVGREAEGVTGEVYEKLKKEFNRPPSHEDSP